MRCQKGRTDGSGGPAKSSPGLSSQSITQEKMVATVPAQHEEVLLWRLDFFRVCMCPVFVDAHSCSGVCACAGQRSPLGAVSWVPVTLFFRLGLSLTCSSSKRLGSLPVSSKIHLFPLSQSWDYKQAQCLILFVLFSCCDCFGFTWALEIKRRSVCFPRKHFTDSFFSLA